MRREPPDTLRGLAALSSRRACRRSSTRALRERHLCRLLLVAAEVGDAHGLTGLVVSQDVQHVADVAHVLSRYGHDHVLRLQASLVRGRTGSDVGHADSLLHREIEGRREGGVMSVAAMPRSPRWISPLWISCCTIGWASAAEIAKPMPCASASACRVDADDVSVDIDEAAAGVAGLMLASV